MSKNASLSVNSERICHRNSDEAIQMQEKQMDVRVREAEIRALHVWHASMVLLVRPGESMGIPIYETFALANTSDRGDAPYHLLVIEVDDPTDEATQARVRANLRSFGL